MTIGWIRDLVIIISGVIAIGAFTFIGIVAYSIYRRATRLMESLETASSAFKDVCSCVTEPLSSPWNVITTTFQGVRQGIESINKVFRGEVSHEKG